MLVLSSGTVKSVPGRRRAMIGQDPTSSLSLSQVTTTIYDFMIANLTQGLFQTKKIMESGQCINHEHHSRVRSTSNICQESNSVILPFKETYLCTIHLNVRGEGMKWFWNKKERSIILSVNKEENTGDISK